MSGRRLAACAALALLAAGAPAQEAVLGGWALPEGAVVHSTSRTEMQATFSGPGGKAPVKSWSSDSTVTRIDRVEGGRLVRAVQRHEAEAGQTLVDGRPVPDAPDPLLSREVAVERDGAGWRRSALGWRPSAAEREALDEPATLDDAEYPARPVAVGETVVVPDSALRRVYLGAAEGPHRLTVRLDSLGTFEGGPAAFLTQEVQVVVDVGGGTMTMDMTARIVRRLDWMLDVRTEWEGPVAFEYPGAAGGGTMRYVAEQTVALPDGGP